MSRSADHGHYVYRQRCSVNHYVLFRAIFQIVGNPVIPGKRYRAYLNGGNATIREEVKSAPNEILWDQTGGLSAGETFPPDHDCGVRKSLKMIKSPQRKAGMLMPRANLHRILLKMHERPET
jgi:hypothetical protein